MSNKKSKILIIEDDSMQEMMYRVEFENHAYNVFSAPNVDTGYEILIKQKPDLVLLDLLLGEKKGTELLVRLEEKRILDKFKIIVFTNFTKKEVRQECLDMGAYDFLIKSELTPRELVEKISKEFLN